MKLEEFPQGEKPEQCCCCDYFSLAERGKCLVCPVCFWEDDSSDSEQLDLDTPSDLNNDMTLRQARDNFKAHGAFEPKFADVVICEAERNTIEYRNRNV